MGCFSSVNLLVVEDKKKSNIKPLNKTEIENESFEEHSCNLNHDNNKKDNFNINNIPFDVLKSYKYYFANKNYKSCEVGEEQKENKKKIEITKINKKNDKKEIKEINNEIKNIKIIEDMDVDIKEYKKYIIKNDKQDDNNGQNGDSHLPDDNNAVINTNNSNKINNDKKNESKILRKSIEERITKYNIKNENEKNKDYEDSICNLGQSYIKDKK